MEHFDAETGSKDIDLRRGYQNLDSDNALAYLRYTDENNDNFGRVQRQERFLNYGLIGNKILGLLQKLGIYGAYGVIMKVIYLHGCY